jgi:tetraprenyl-beta-curcumene synthase
LIIETKYLKGTPLIFKYISKVFPEVNTQLKRWVIASGRVEDNILREQALSSISLKKFHAQGGSVYALYPHVKLLNAVSLIVALQTINDYLDNLCDRAKVYDEAAFRQLHLSMLDAVDPNRPTQDYYLYYPYKEDKNYLNKLVAECRIQIKKLPSYDLVKDAIKKYVGLYSDLQTYKHLSHEIRESSLTRWASDYLHQYPEISCWEFSAATGSTLGIFILFSAAADPRLTAWEVQAIDTAYFPWVCGLHILLDYYIDLEEDILMKELNFTYYYDSLKECEDRLSFFIERAFKSCASLRYSGFHSTIIKGLLAMYLSDPKALTGLNRITSRNLIQRGGKRTILYFNLCKFLRELKVL